VQGRYKMGTIAELTGFSPAVLRAWERRFGLLDPERVPSGHRLYTDEDLAVLRRVRAYLDAGRSIGEVAVLGRPALLGAARVLAPEPPERGPARAVPAVIDARPPAADAAPATAGLDAAREAIVAAAVAVDPRALRQAVDRAFASVSAALAIERVIPPAAYRIGELWAEGRCSVAGEHLASAVLRERLRRLVDEAEPLGAAAPVAVCACVPDEAHELGALAVAYRLARLGVRVVYLGADTPLDDVLGACQRTGAGHAFLSVSREPLYGALRPALRRFVRRASATCRVVLGGLGAPAEDADLEADGALLWPAARSLDELEPLLVDRSAPAAPQQQRRRATRRQAAATRRRRGR
jgi:hypothetical protein